jgi:hypothetical protein
MLTPDQAAAAGLTPCRTCSPAEVEVDLASS